MSASSLRSFEYLEQLPGTVFKRLYQQPSTALAIFRRMLTGLAKDFVTAILFLDEPFDLELLVRPGSARERDQALSLLDRLHILSTVPGTAHGRAYRLTNPFQKSMRLALTGGGDHRSFGVPCDTPPEQRASAKLLDEYARAQWEAILYYIVGSAGPAAANIADIGEGSKQLLEDGNLVEIHGKTARITKAGFEFLLQEVNAQVWSLLIVYLDGAEERGMDSVDVLSFLFTLGSLEVGQDYSTGTLTPTQSQMLEDLSDLGIVYRSAAESDRFYPTRLATTLTSDNSSTSLTTTFTPLRAALNKPDANSSSSAGFIIVETNYRIYAYTSSPLLITILSLFTKLSTRYPNLATGKLTQRSIQRAIALGITSDQIVAYLGTHAHPQMRARAAASGNPILPPTVVDQIRLWQIEGDRMKTTSGFLFREFGDRAEWEDCVRYADTIGVVVWRDDANRRFFVSRHELLATYITSRKKRLDAARNGTAASGSSNSASGRTNASGRANGA